MVNNFWDNVFSLMKNKKITQEKLCKDTGISVNTIRCGASKNSIPKIDLAKQLADYLGTSVDYLISGVESDIYRIKYENLKNKILKDLEDN